jgi:hypothetical protein
MAFNKVLDGVNKNSYLAYGSNMECPVMEGRGIQPFAV